MPGWAAERVADQVGGVADGDEGDRHAAEHEGDRKAGEQRARKAQHGHDEGVRPGDRPACASTAATRGQPEPRGQPRAARPPAGQPPPASHRGRPSSVASERISRATAARATNPQARRQGRLDDEGKGSPCSLTDRSPMVKAWATAAKPCQQSRAARGRTKPMSPAASMEALARGLQAAWRRSSRTWLSVARQRRRRAWPGRRRAASAALQARRR